MNTRRRSAGGARREWNEKHRQAAGEGLGSRKTRGDRGQSRHSAEEAGGEGRTRVPKRKADELDNPRKGGGFEPATPRAQPDPQGGPIGHYKHPTGGIFQDIASFAIFFDSREAHF